MDKLQIYTNKGYFARNAKNGNIVFNESPEMGYFFNMDEAKIVKSNVKKEFPNLEFVKIVEFDKNWYKSADFIPKEVAVETKRKIKITKKRKLSVLKRTKNK